MFLLQSIYFIFLVFTVFYLPGRFLISLFKYKINDIVVLHSVSFAIGLSSFLLSTYVLSWFGLGILYNLFILPIIFWEGRKIIKAFKLDLSVFSIELLLITFGSLTMTYLTGRSGLPTADGLIFFSNNAFDGIYHLALIGNLIHHFPPTHPELAGVPLRGYHFFYDFLAGNLSNFYRLNSLDLIFRFLPIFISFIYGLELFAIGRFLKLSKYAVYLLLFLGYFGAGFEFILQKISPSMVYNPGVNPLILNIINPSVLLGMSLLFAFYILIFTPNKSKMVFLPAILLGVMPQVKIYIAILGFASLGAVALLDLARNRKTYYLKILIEAGIIASIVYLPFNFGSGGLIFTPFLLYRHFMEQLSASWAQKLQVFESYSNIPQMLILYFQALLLFFIPTLGLRLFSLFQLKTLKEKKFYSSNNIFWIVFVLLGLILASFFIQTADVFNIVQFIWPIYILLFIPTSIAIGNIANKNNTFKILTFIVVIVVSFLPTVRIIDAYLNDKHLIDKDTLLIATFIKEKVPQQKQILVLNIQNEHILYNLPQISALSQHQIFYEPTITTFNESEMTKNERKIIVNKLDTMLASCTGDVGNEIRKAFLKTNNDYLLTLKNYNCIESVPYLKEVVSYGEKHLYILSP